MDRIDAIINAMVSRWEGGYSDNKTDRGGPTNYGITILVYSEFLGKPATAAMVKAMPRSTAIAIYRSRYWLGVNIDRLPVELQPVVFDMAVNMGPGTGVRLLQMALLDLDRHVMVDGVIGLITSGTASRAIADLGAKRVIDALCDRRRDYYQHIITNDPSQVIYRRGWLTRCESYRLPV